MAKRNIDARPVMPSMEVTTEAARRNVAVEEGAAVDVARYSGDDAQELFKQLMKDLKEKRQQAKNAGESPADVKAIKFDQLKGTDTYNKWVEASREVEYASWKEIEQNLHSKLDKAQDAGEDVEQSGGLFDQWEKANAIFAKITQARKEITHLEHRKTEIKEELARVAEVSEKFPGSRQKLTEESNRLAADEAVVGAEVGAVEEIITDSSNAGSLVEVGGSEALSASMLGQLNERAMARFFSDNNGESGEQVEVNSGGRGVEKINAFFLKELKNIRKTKDHGKDIFFAGELKKFVGDDEVFATLLLSDDDFVDTVRSFFGAKNENDAFSKAADLSYLLKHAADSYERSLETVPVESMDGRQEVSAEEPPEIPLEILNNSSDFSIEEISEMAGDLRDLRRDMDEEQKGLQILEDQLAKTSLFFGGKKRKDLLDQIQSAKNKIAELVGSLVGITEGLSANASANSNIESFQAVAYEAEELNKNIKSGNLSPGSSRSNRYTKLIMVAIAGLITSYTADKGGSKAMPEKPQAGSTFDLNEGGAKSNFGGGDMSGMSEARPDAPNVTRAVDMSKMSEVPQSDGGASEPEPEVAGGFTPAGDFIKSAPDTKTPAPGKYKLRSRSGEQIAAVSIGGESIVPAAEAVVAPAVVSAEAVPKREYTSGELSKQIEQFSADHPELTAREGNLVQKLYEASRTKGKKGFDSLAEAETVFLSLGNTSKPKLKEFRSLIDGLRSAKNKEKPAAKKEGTPSLDEISQKIEQFSANTDNMMTENEDKLTHLLYKASKTPGKAGQILLKKATDARSFLVTSPKKAENFDYLIKLLTAAHEDGQSEIPDLVFSK